MPNACHYLLLSTAFFSGYSVTKQKSIATVGEAFSRVAGQSKDNLRNRFVFYTRNITIYRKELKMLSHDEPIFE